MKISYKTIKRYIKNLKTAEEVAKDLIMHAAEVEEIHSQAKDFENIVFGEIKKVNDHPDADSLRVCEVDAGEKELLQIVCGWSNLKVWQKVAIAKIWASVSWHGWETVVMKKTAIRWVDSYGMICASDEIWLAKDFPAKDSKEILDLSHLDFPTWTALDKVLWKDDSILEVDNKAINHRPDLFSHIGIIREIEAINWQKFDYIYENKDFSKLKKLGIKNEIPEVVKRYIWLKIENVANSKSPDYVKEVLEASWCESKGLLIDLSNYSLYMYGQPTHIFDADKISWDILIRYAKDGEKFLALDDREYELKQTDIVIADEKEVIALWWIIWWKNSSVNENTKNIIIESANFDQANVRITWKRLGIRTDSLNVFEKDIVPETAKYWLSLIVSELEKSFKNLETISYSDVYPIKQEEISINYDLDFINNLIGKNYDKKEVESILDNLGIEIKQNKLLIPAWRKDLRYKADIAEEIARIDWYDKIEKSIPSINLWAISQDNIYKLKNDSRLYFTNKGFFDMYNYSFVNKELMEKLEYKKDDLVDLKNYLSLEASHLRPNLISNLMLSLEKNIKSFENMKLFEIEKVFKKENKEVKESYNMAGLMMSEKEIAYYDMQNIVSDFLKSIWVDKYYYDIAKETEDFAHTHRTANLVIRWQTVWQVWEIHPIVSKRFWIKSRVWFFELDAEKIANMAYNTTKAKDVSIFQENNFDLNFIVDKKTKWRDIQIAISLSDKNLIQKVELFDIYENEEKLVWKRSLSFKIFIQSQSETLSDEVKSELIKKIISKVEKKWWKLRD